MKMKMKKLTVLVGLVVLALALAQAWAQAQEPIVEPLPKLSTDYQAGFELGLAKGREDVHFLPVCLGSFLFPLPGALITMLTPPAGPTVSALLLIQGKSDEFKAGFLDGYRKGKWERRKEISGLCAGLGVLANALIILATQTGY